MMLMNLFPRLKPGMAYIIALCALVPTVILPATYYAQTQGVCLKAGRILSEEELREAVLVNIVNSEIETAFHGNWKGGHDRNWVGIGSPIQESDLRRLIDKSYNSDKSIEENLGLEVLLEGRNKGKYKILVSKHLTEPFILVNYEPIQNGRMVFFSSENAQGVSFDDLNAEYKEIAKREMTLYRKLLGYGNYYFHFYTPSFITLERECCDNRNKDGKDYLKKKREAYERAVLSITTHAKIRNLVPTIAAVSNCGNIWMTKDNSIHWLGNQFEDEDWP
ncbi:MAG: hypothetical protein LBP58_09000 [Azoarcus sp.]|jgi:hypothetical protein|nr:hypothetical protein [Azoarcus sp.]